MERTINITVRDKIAVAERNAQYICGNSDFVVSFDFDEEWNEHDHKTARFAYNGEYQDVIFTGNTCAVPIISSAYNIKVGVYAGDLRTTTPAYISAKKSILCDGGLPADPTPDVYAQIMERLDDMGKVDISQEDIEQAVSDYLEENPVEGGGVTNWNDLTDRPFYETITEGSEILPETTITFSGGSATIPDSAYSGEFTGGQRYMIEIDGEGHTATAVYAGNPVYDYYFDTDDGLFSFSGRLDISGPHEDGDATIRIYEVAVEIKTLDSKFLTMDEEVLADGNNPVPGKVLYYALGGKLDKKYDTTSAGRLLAVGPTGYVALRRDGMVGATASEAGFSGFVPTPAAGDQDKVLHGDGTWKTPETGGDFIPVPETAEVGQTIRVSAVDENGKPTAWETVDMASGGSGGESGGSEIDIGRSPDLVIEITEAITSLSVSEINGKSIEATEMVVLWEHPKGDAYIPNYFRWNNVVKDGTDTTAILANHNLPTDICPSANSDAAVFCKVKKINDGAYKYEFCGLQQDPGTVVGAFKPMYSAVYRNILGGETSIKEFFVYQSKQIQPGCKVSIWVV